MGWNNQKRPYRNAVKPLLSIGKLRHRIALQDYVSIKNSFGEETKTWSDFAKAWANVQPLSGKELFAAQQLHAETTTQIVIRCVEGANTKMRVVFESKEYDILHISNKEELNIAMYLLCKEHEEVV